jgi:hypothetical protein
MGGEWLYSASVAAVAPLVNVSGVAVREGNTIRQVVAETAVEAVFTPRSAEPWTISATATQRTRAGIL